MRVLYVSRVCFTSVPRIEHLSMLGETKNACLIHVLFISLHACGLQVNSVLRVKLVAVCKVPDWLE